MEILLMYYTFNRVGACKVNAAVWWWHPPPQKKNYISLIVTESLDGIMFVFKNNSGLLHSPKGRWINSSEIPISS